MKFRKGQKVLEVPPMGDILEAWLDFPDRVVQIQVVTMTRLLQARKNTSKTAWPMFMAHALGAHEVHLWPTPHKAGELKIRYYPVPVVI